MKIEDCKTREDYRSFAVETMDTSVAWSEDQAKLAVLSLLVNQVNALTAAVLSLQAPTRDEQKHESRDRILGKPLEVNR